MRQATGIRPARTPFPGPRRIVAAGAPIAIVGSLALTAGAAPAAAAPPRDADHRLPHVRAALGSDPRTAAAPRVAADVASVEDTVQPGDTVSAIAARHGLRTSDVLALNGLGWDSIIQPGQVLRLRGETTPPAPEAAPAPPSAVAHTVVAGDTVFAIAAKYGSTVDAVLAANGLTRASIIYPGQTIAVPAAASAPAMAPVAASAPAATADLDAEQTANARLIIEIGRELGVPDRGIAIALGTAMQESWLRNLDWGDRDSLGLFQQRPSTGWGTAEEVRDPARATRAFFGGSGDPNGDLTRGLLDIPGWESMSFADAAQAVQISAYPERYAQWEQPATTWLAALG
jgi:N-acetylmuramoyl-L-alanine amidase